jgi:ABC-type multidrug transport system fused ATPase/permease subunit
VAVERILQFNRVKEEPPEKNSQVFQNWPSNGHIKFQNYCMKYRQDGELILNDISLDLPALTKTSIIGRTGSGKSSLILSLFRYDPYKNSVVS